MNPYTGTSEQQPSTQDGPDTGENAPGYGLFRRSTYQVLDAPSLHGLAHAYRTAWRAMHDSEPRGWHAIESLDLLIEFY